MFGYFQPDHSGYINPRRLVQAQLVLAQSSGCELIRSGWDSKCRTERLKPFLPIRSGVRGISRDSVSGGFVLALLSGETVTAKNVLLATGAFLNISGIIKDFVASDLDLRLASQTVAFIKISDSEARVRSPSL